MVINDTRPRRNVISQPDPPAADAPIETDSLAGRRLAGTYHARRTLPIGLQQWRQREFKVGGDEPCEPTVRLPD